MIFPSVYKNTSQIDKHFVIFHYQQSLLFKCLEAEILLGRIYSQILNQPLNSRRDMKAQ